MSEPHDLLHPPQTLLPWLFSCLHVDATHGAADAHCRPAEYFKPRAPGGSTSATTQAQSSAVVAARAIVLAAAAAAEQRILLSCVRGRGEAGQGSSVGGWRVLLVYATQAEGRTRTGAVLEPAATKVYQVGGTTRRQATWQGCRGSL